MLTLSFQCTCLVITILSSTTTLRLSPNGSWFKHNSLKSLQLWTCTCEYDLHLVMMDFLSCHYQFFHACICICYKNVNIIIQLSIVYYKVHLHYQRNQALSLFKFIHWILLIPMWIYLFFPSLCRDEVSPNSIQ